MMESLQPINFEKPLVTSETQTTASNTNSINTPGISVFSPHATPFQSRLTSDTLRCVSQPEPKVADTAPSSIDLESIMNQCLENNQLYDSGFKSQLYHTENKQDSMSTQSNLWSDDSSAYGSRKCEMIETFEFLIKSLTSANDFVSTLTREQLELLRTMRPTVFHDILLEAARVDSERRLRRVNCKECAFCKNNGENEEHYSSHALKDWRGRVLCPVLRAFNCPRCGATGDRAHTIKYCPYNVEQVSERAGSLLQRRRASHTSLLGGGSATPASSPATATATALNSSPWPNFGNN